MEKQHWEFISSPEEYGIECSKCKHKIGAKDAFLADRVSIKTCPFCHSEMDMSNFDYDKLFDMALSSMRIIGI